MTVEFAICASVFFMVVFTLLEFSRFVFVKHSIQMVAYEACRVGVIPGATNQHVTNQAQAMLTATGVRNASVTITPAVINSLTEEVTVTVSCNFTENSWLPPTYLTGQTIQSSLTLGHENKAYMQNANVDITDVVGDNNDEPVDE